VEACDEFEFGIGRIATNHYVLRFPSIPQLLLMNRRTFASLLATARQIIGRYSGEWGSQHFIRAHQAEAEEAMDRLRSDARRDVVSPTPSDQRRSRAAFASVIDQHVGDDPHKREVLRAIEAELATIRSSSSSID